jgi:hypothetical protein
MIRSLQPAGHGPGVHAITRFPRLSGAAATPSHSANQTSAVARDRITRAARR